MQSDKKERRTSDHFGFFLEKNQNVIQKQFQSKTVVPPLSQHASAGQEWPRERLLNDGAPVNPFTTGNPILGTRLLGFSIGRGSGALKRPSSEFCCLLLHGFRCIPAAVYLSMVLPLIGFSCVHRNEQF